MAEENLIWGITREELDELRNQAREKMSHHKWRQKGEWLICQQCQIKHAINIGQKIMVGEEDDGTPILVERVLQSQTL